MSDDQNNTNSDQDLEKQSAELRDSILEDSKEYDSTKTFEVTEEELLTVVNFLKVRVADLTFEVGYSEAKFANLVKYTKLLEERLKIQGESLASAKHPDA